MKYSLRNSFGNINTQYPITCLWPFPVEHEAAMMGNEIAKRHHAWRACVLILVTSLSFPSPPSRRSSDEFISWDIEVTVGNAESFLFLPSSRKMQSNHSIIRWNATKRIHERTAVQILSFRSDALSLKKEASEAAASPAHTKQLSSSNSGRVPPRHRRSVPPAERLTCSEYFTTSTAS